ncbi:hypothetical protein AtNW77_Chr3g0188701 [Arabidopsis thaliana]
MAESTKQHIDLIRETKFSIGRAYNPLTEDLHQAHRNCNLGYIVPEWVEKRPSLVDIQKINGFGSAIPTTTIIMPLKSDKVKPVKEQLSNVHPEIHYQDKVSIVNSHGIVSETNLVSRKSIDAESQKLTVKNENRVGRRGEVEELLTTLVFLLGDRLALGDSFPPSIYAFLPTEMVTNFPFIIQGDFILASSR